VLRDTYFYEAERLAWLPLSFLAEQDLPATLSDPLCGSAAAYHDVMLSSLWIYQLHAYRDLVRAGLGLGVADEVQAFQREILNREQAGSGDAVIDAMGLVDTALQAVCREARAHPGDNSPGELGVAMALLMGLPDSPDYQETPAGLHEPVAWRLPGIEQCLAALLSAGQQALLSAFSPLFVSRAS